MHRGEQASGGKVEQFDCAPSPGIVPVHEIKSETVGGGCAVIDIDGHRLHAWGWITCNYRSEASAAVSFPVGDEGPRV